MDIFDNKINRQLISGNLPSEKLLISDIGEIKKIDFSKYSSYGLNKIKEEIKSTPYMMFAYKEIFKEISKTDGLLSKHEVNLLINTGYLNGEINENDSSYLKALELIPAVTELDQILLVGAVVVYDKYSHKVHLDNFDGKEELFTWIYLLRLLEEKEAKYGFTISSDLYDTGACLDYILEEWDLDDDTKYFRIEQNQHKKICKLIKDRADICDEIQEDLLRGRDYAQKTLDDWKTFIDILNELSKYEKDVFDNIKKAISSNEKLSSFNDYDMAVYRIRRGRFELCGKEIDLLTLFDSILERYKISAPYCKVILEDGKAFRLHYAAACLAMDPRTYNYYFMKYHQLRLAPSKDRARDFASLALESLCKNLGEEYEDIISVDEIIEKYDNLIRDFIRNNQKIIDSLNYSDIQIDSISNGFSEELQFIGLLEDVLTPNYSINQLSGNSVSDIIKSINEDFEKKEIKIREIVIGRRIIISLNMIYLFANSIGIMLTDRHINIIKNIQKAERIRYGILNEVSKLVSKVYSDISNEYMSIQEYREKNAIDTTYLSEKEKQANEYNSLVCTESLKTNITNLIKDIGTCSIDKLLERKKCIIDQISQFPMCLEKELYSEWIDQLCSDICDSMVSLCREDDDFDDIQGELRSDLGINIDILPKGTTDSLITAELLYKKYASEEYANKGFDYSSISALYYQAFENAYNKLIWKGYADFLNGLVIDGKKFVNIMQNEQGKELNDPKIMGYLDRRHKKRKHYIEYAFGNVSEPSVVIHCMYGNFGILMENIKISNPLDKFSSYFATLTGFTKTDEMLNDRTFMAKCRTFASNINSSAPNRNNASHGGSIIDLAQCKKDKIIILDNLADVRSSNIGLIKQIIDILTYNKK